MTQYIKRLPAVFQTVTEKKFFDATFDQVFSKKDSEYLTGYLGRRNPGRFNPISDFYIPEPSKNRTWWQLEATSFARNPDTSKTNIFFYEDLLERIESFGGNTLNQDRLFDSEYYSFGPPIDYDMFTNYQNYYWIESGLPAIRIVGVTNADITGKESFITPAGLTLTTGMTVILEDDIDFLEPHYIENFGGVRGIELVKRSNTITPGVEFEFLPWDGKNSTTTGRFIQNLFWDATTWEVQARPGFGDYVTIQRGAQDANAWSRTNRWFHIDAINSALAATSISFPNNATRALRPIIQFSADMELFGAGTTFRNEVSFAFGNTFVNTPILFSDLEGRQLTDINNEYNIELTNGKLVVFLNDSTSDVADYIWVTNVTPAGGTEIVNFSRHTSVESPMVEGDIILVLEAGPGLSAQAGQSWYYSDGRWLAVFNEKIRPNQAPLFQLYDHDDVKLNDSSKYPNSTFAGSKVFSYKLNTTSGAIEDPVLKFPIVYKSLAQASDIVFQNNLIVDRYTYTLQRESLDGFYYYKFFNIPVLYNSWDLHALCEHDSITATQDAISYVEVSKQRVIDKFTVGFGSEYKFKLSVTPFGYPNNPDIIVTVNGVEVKNSTAISQYSFETINKSIYVVLTGYIDNLLSTRPSVSPVVEIQTYTHENLVPEESGYFQIPQQLEANPTQEEVTELSGSELTEHFVSIISNQIGFTGSAFGGVNNYRDLKKNRSLGKFILQNVAPALKSMLVSSSEDLDFIIAERFSQDEYTKFKNKYLSVAKQLISQEFDPVQHYNNTVVVGAWVSQILKTINISKEFSDSFAYSYMVAAGTPTYIHAVSSSPPAILLDDSYILLNSDNIRLEDNVIDVPESDLIVILPVYVDLSDPSNILYIYDIQPNGVENLLLAGVDYTIQSTEPEAVIKLKEAVGRKKLSFYVYENPIPTYVPSTPTKLGMHGSYIPRIELDTTYVDPTCVIIGHDGSKTVAFGDYRDQLLLELEKRIYNSLQTKFRGEHYLPIRNESIRTGYFRNTRYSRDEYLEITNAYLNKWASKNRANYRTNEWLTASLDPAIIPTFDAGPASLYQLILATSGQTIFNTSITTKSSSAGLVYLLVFRNGVMQTEGLAYDVTGTNQITFDLGVSSDDEIIIYTFIGPNALASEVQIATSLQTVVNSAILPDLVFINGVQQVTNVGYTVTGPSEITLTASLTAGQDISLFSFLGNGALYSSSVVATSGQTVINTPFIISGERGYDNGCGSGFGACAGLTFTGIVFRNGVYQLEGTSGSYVISGPSQLTFDAPLISGDDISFYFYEIVGIPPGNIWKLYNYKRALGTVVNPLATSLYQSFIAANGQTVFNTSILTTAQTLDTAYLLVFKDGIIQLEGVLFDYRVTSPNQITFNTGVSAGDSIVVHAFDLPQSLQYEVQSSTDSQTTVTTSVSPDLVFINGVQQVSGIDYTLAGPGEITLSDPISSGLDIYLFSFSGAIAPIIYDVLATAGQTVINTIMPTSPGGAGIIFRNGIYQLEGATGSYIVTGPTQLTFNTPLLAGDSISFCFRGSEILPTLPGNWKGIFQYYYDTYDPDTRPWEMLGFTEEPSWWRAEYGNPIPNYAGQCVWGSDSFAANSLYNDIALGIIRQGPTALYDPITLTAQPQTMWARPNISALLPVTATGEIRSVMEIFSVVFSGNYYAPFDGFDDDWAYGDGAPVEQAWMSTSGFKFAVQEFLYLMKPGPFGEYSWDTLGTEVSPGTVIISGKQGPMRSTKNWQYVQNDVYSSTDQFFAWGRPKNSTQRVHAESVDGEIQLRFGYQTWISDKILFSGKDVGTVFGQKIRTLNVNMANKLAGFTNKETTNTYIESVTPGTTNDSLIIPSTNFDVILHKSPVVDTYSYSGIIIRALENGSFVVYGYDLLNSEFLSLDRSSDKLIDVSIGGTPEEFSQYESGATYLPGDIVRYNGVYYRSLVTQLVTKFISTGYIKLAALPIVGGISVSYKPISNASVTRVPYGTVLGSPQEVFDLMIGWGAYLESKGWQFQDVSQETNLLSDWLNSAKQFLFWLNTNWAPDASIQLSPLANSATLVVARGYPDDVEEMANGVYCILDKNGVAIPQSETSTDRDGQSITIYPSSLSSGGIFYAQINVSETEHVLIFDNSTNFNDIIYSPLLRARQQRLRFAGFRSNGWYGKMEAPGYLIIDNQLVPNYDTIVEAMRYYYDPNITIDNPSLEDLGRRLIGYESKSYLDNLQVSNDVQYLFYQGAIRQKGTSQAFEKLFRSTKVQSDEIIQVFEEWALKLSDFGNTIDRVSTEFKLRPEQNTGEVIVARLNYVPSAIGFVKSINIINAENSYVAIPKVIISGPDAGNIQLPPGKTLRQASAYITLNATGNISRIDIVDPGYGYLKEPIIVIDSGIESNSLDRLYAVWQGEIISDKVLDNIINIDIDDTDVWKTRPLDPALSLEFPVTNIVDYSMPNAGYVHFGDVDFSIFDAELAVSTWGSNEFNPTVGKTIWVANTFTGDWDVYKLVDKSSESQFDIIENDAGNLQLRTLKPYLISSQFSDTASSTDFGNMIVLQVQESRAIAVLGTAPIPDDVIEEIQVTRTGANYTHIPTVSISGGGGTGATAIATILDGKVIGIIITAPGSGYTTTPEVTITPPSEIGGDTNFAIRMNFNESDTENINDGYNYYDILALDSTDIASTDLPDYVNFTNLLLFKTMRFLSIPPVSNIPSYVADGNKIWVDRMGVEPMTTWSVLTLGSDYNDTKFYPYRVQEPLINTPLFESATVFGDTGRNEAILPIYDPFKNILPGQAKQNLSYIRLQDPVKYNVTDDARLFSENINFGRDQVGKLWWDLSSVKFVYYEQPISVDRDGNELETELDNMVYRRDRWAQIFPGSTVDIYEWVESNVTPEEYTGTGTPRDINTYVQIITSNKFTNITVIKYYFWVLGASIVPNVINRTLAATRVSRLLASPKEQGYSFFAPIQQTDTNNSYMFYNMKDVLAYKGDNIQIQYRVSEREDQEHTQWSFFREGDPNSLISDQFWDKMVDSIVGYTKVLPLSEEYSNYIVISEGVAWDEDVLIGSVGSFENFNWDASSYGIILPVPDPELAEAEKYGSLYRPRQGMFADLPAARKVFVQASNELLRKIPIRDTSPVWNIGISSNRYWTYTNWYKTGFENVIPTIIFNNLFSANSAMMAGQLMEGTILQVTNGTVDGRFQLYSVSRPSVNLQILSLELVAIQNSSVMILDTAYTDVNKYKLSSELRQLLNAFRSDVFINANLVDQNELFGAMLNYVLSEQRTPDWVFKSSYIYIKENNLPLSRPSTYIPSQIDNIADFIIDSKPYHTKIRDFTSTYTTFDTSPGTSNDEAQATILTYAPWDPCDSPLIEQARPDVSSPNSPNNATLLYAEPCSGIDRWDRDADSVTPDKWDEILSTETIELSLPTD